LHTTAGKHGKVVVTGVGKAGDVGRKIVSAFNSTGVSAVFLSPLDARHGDLGVIGAHDLLFLISNSGKTSEITELVTLARRLHPKIKTVCLTGNPRSPLARAADYVLATGNPKEVCPLGLTPTTSVLAMLAIADVLTVLSMKSRNYSPREYQLRHHGGYLGRKAKKLARK
jgi:arabinose-5-phosphate isomerase